MYSTSFDLEERVMRIDILNSVPTLPTVGMQIWYKSSIYRVDNVRLMYDETTGNQAVLEYVLVFLSLVQAPEEYKVQAPETDKPMPYVSVYKPMAGWKAVIYSWNDDEPDAAPFWEPWQTSEIVYSTKEEAIAVAKSWAAAEELEYRDPPEEDEQE